MRIGYLGPAGTHSQSAAQRFISEAFPSSGQTANRLFVPFMSLTHILDAVRDGLVDLGCVPAENALEGSVTEVLDYMTGCPEGRMTIAAEFVRPIAHALIRKYPFTEGIRFVHSHPQAIAQCRKSVYERLGSDVSFVPAASTSEAVRSLVDLDETHAALGTPQAAGYYNLDILIDNLCDAKHNATRFLIVMPTDSPVRDVIDSGALSGLPKKTSICVGLYHNRPGSLLEMLQLLADQGLNLSKIESRPTKKSLGEYVFYLDIEGEISADTVTILQAHASLYKCLGYYPALGVLEDKQVV